MAEERHGFYIWRISFRRREQLQANTDEVEFYDKM